MSQHTTLMLMLACAGLLPACGHLPGPASQHSQANHAAPPRARSIDSPAARSAAFCKLGKRMQELGDPRAAMAAYREALLLEPDSADARNGAAVLHAQLGQLDTARAMLQALAQEAPTARTYNNLGYVLYLQGDYDQAASVLRQSLQLDNGQQPARANLDLAIAALARSVSTVDAIDATADAVAPDLAPAPKPAAPASRLQLTQSQPNIFTLSWRDTPVAPRAAPAAVPALAKQAAPLPRLEVINGNGETGMAARMRGMLGGMGISVLRLGNQRPYGIQASSIVYRPGHAEAAAALALALGGMPQLQAAGDSGIGAGADLRLLLGKDAAASLRAPDVRLASNATP
ncbi:tetratricopeptide repeat protein [Janthinobacterium sp. SUN098]|uniref:tetratricopeptide repeat protein n=1 Tax=Janthinobacterium sp. SUN098 TaxID=3002437 RepID=UPI0038D454F9